MKGKKTGGRRRGTPNRTTAEIREALRAFIDANLHRLQEDYDTLDSEKRFVFFEKIARMILPAPVNPDALTAEQMQEIISYLEDKERETRP